MLLRKPKGTQFNCFTPPVMLATIIIEISLATYALWRYKLSNLTRLVAVFLIALATFQVAEYFVCTSASHGEQWSRLGFIAITALPPIGLHLMHMLANKPNRKLVVAGYASMVAFSVFFLLAQNTFNGHQCTGNYVIFQFSQNVTGIYSLYYYAWLLVGIGLGIHWANELHDKGKAQLKRLQSVRALVAGYFVFLVPTAVANTIRPETRRGIPSIMCGFAVLLALILVLYILPRMAELKRSNRAKT